MANEQRTQDQQQQAQQQPAAPGNQQGAAPSPAQAQDQGQDQNAQSAQHGTPTDFDGLKDKKPEELTPEDLRWMADTMPGEGPGD